MNKILKILGIGLILAIMMASLIYAGETIIEKVTDTRITDYVADNKGELTEVEYKDVVVNQTILKRVKKDQMQKLQELTENIVDHNPSKVDEVIEY